MDKLNVIVLVFCVLIIIAFVMFWMKRKENFTVEKSRIVLYFSPQCGHCKAFMNTWNEFETRVNTHNDINAVATKINCTEQECPNISGFPTVLIHKNNGKTITFNDKRTVEALEKFVKSNL